MPFLFIIRNYSPEIINIQRREAELNITLPRVNNFDIKQKGMKYMPPIPNRIWKMKADKTKQISIKALVCFFFVKVELKHI